MPQLIDEADFAPFRVCERGARPPRPRRMGTTAGLGDRMRTAAFAELQAVHAFTYAAERFEEVPAQLRDAWRAQIADEQRHHDMIRQRMLELGCDIAERPVSTALWWSLMECADGGEFCIKIAGAEERGRQAALRLAAFLEQRDPRTAELFKIIADEEIAHVALARTYFDWSP